MYYIEPAKAYDVYYNHPALGKIHAGRYTGSNAKECAQHYADNMNKAMGFDKQTRLF